MNYCLKTTPKLRWESNDDDLPDAFIKRLRISSAVVMAERLVRYYVPEIGSYEDKSARLVVISFNLQMPLSSPLSPFHYESKIELWNSCPKLSE